MIKLYLLQEGSTFIAFNPEGERGDRVHGLTGSIFDAWAESAGYLHGEDFSFKYDEFKIQTDDYEAEWDDNLVGYFITFSDGRQVQTQTDIEDNVLHGDYGQTYLERYTMYDDELDEKQNKLVDDFVENVNKLKRHFDFDEG